jgi:hypothetical protein
MSYTSDPGDIRELLPPENSPPRGKLHCPMCGGADLFRFSGVPVRELAANQGVVPVAHLLSNPSYGLHVIRGSPLIFFLQLLGHGQRSGSNPRAKARSVLARVSLVRLHGVASRLR